MPVIKRTALSRTSTSSTISTVSTLVEVPADKHITCEQVLRLNLDRCHTCSTALALPLFTSLSAIHTDTVFQGKKLSIPPITARLKKILTTHVAALSTPLRIVGLLASDDEGSATYATLTQRACERNGVGFEIWHVDSQLDQAELQDARLARFSRISADIKRANDDPTIDGLIVYFPIFGGSLDDALRTLISPLIDVEGVNPESLRTSYSVPPAPLLHELKTEIPKDDPTTDRPEEAINYPCTPLAVVRCLQSIEGMYDMSKPAGQRLTGKIVTILNRSETVGRPLSAMLANESATVYSFDIDTLHILSSHSSVSLSAAGPHCLMAVHDLSSAGCPKRDDVLGVSDIVISAVPSRGFIIPTRNLKQDAVCINLAGESNFDSDVLDRASLYAERVGAVTITCLQVNALILRARRQVSSRDRD
ncbi:hypothetical protein BCR39DRAFT_494066 [Naematelia encephala]|uniref:Methylenetetrahydrofolate dehydrogenase n=1 Tax=Naematelia encephala TaxID=71784 RepID=A0A1Y2BB09_9TREE|nr:hypothetical protein BCR39DRAFT_494066 [Naematelia encephala]